MPFATASAKEYVDKLDLSGTPRSPIHQDGSEAPTVFDQAKAQARLVGSNLLAFRDGVLAQTREAISDSALLAQLVANKRKDVETDPLGWYKEYATVLDNVGWTMQEGGWDDYSASGTAADVNEQIIQLLPVLLGAAPAALAIVTTAVNALHGMNPNSPWITLFRRESQKTSLARFQVGIVDNAPGGGAEISLLACLIKARAITTQILFFRFKDEKASFKARSGKVTINTAAQTDLAEMIRTKVRAYQKDYLSSILDL